jgi:hypothetical protein
MTTNITYTDTEIIDVAKCQKRVNWLVVWYFIACFAVGFISAIVPQISDLIITLTQIAFVILAAFVIYELAVALKSSNPWVWVLVILIPCGGIIALLILSARASRALKTRGIRIGLMGANNNDLKKIADSAAEEDAKINTENHNEPESYSSEEVTWSEAVTLGAQVFNGLQLSLNIVPSRESWESEFLRQYPQKEISDSVMEELWKDSEAAGRKFDRLSGEKTIQDVVKEILQQRAPEDCNPQ